MGRSRVYATSAYIANHNGRPFIPGSGGGPLPPPPNGPASGHRPPPRHTGQAGGWAQAAAARPGPLLGSRYEPCPPLRRR